MWRALFIVALATAALVVGPVVRSHADKGPGKHSELMKRKLLESQKVLEGIALNDFDKISEHAKELLQISKTAEWRVLKTTEYELFSNAFQNSAIDLAKHAKDKNLDAAALSYVEMTLICVKCHKHVREERKTAFEEPIR
jgi:hypothetical protein